MINNTTPIEKHNEIWVKRDDLFIIAGVCGGKVRTCWELSQGAVGLITAGSRMSPQVDIVAHIARKLKIPCHLHVPSGKYTPILTSASKTGAKIIQHRPGYNSVIIARSRSDALETGWAEIPFGMECQEAVIQTSKQVVNLKSISNEIDRIIVPVGSGMSLAGILHGLKENKLDIPVCGICVGAEPTKRLDKYAPIDWRDKTTLLKSDLDYHKQPRNLWLDFDLKLDPIYEAKCIPFLKSNDLFWVVGIRKHEMTQH